jgi:hypothetical protein
MKKLLPLLCLALLTGLRAAPATPTVTVLDDRLRDSAFQFEVLRYVYLWYLDDRFFVNTAEATSFEIWVRPVEPRTRDPEDKSLYAEMWVPAAQIQLKLKLADYPVPELNRQVKSPGFRIIRANPLSDAPGAREGYAVFTYDRQKIRTFLADTRNRPQLPDAALRERLKAAMRETVKLHPPSDPTAPQVFFLSTVSPVSGDLWILWVNEKTAIRFGGEFGADEPDLLSLLPLHTQLFDLKSKVVASLLETEGSTGFITKDWAGRILYQCLVLGERVEVPPEKMGLAPVAK